MPGFQSTRLVTEGALEPFFFLYTDDSIQGNPETCKQSSIMLNYEVKNNHSGGYDLRFYLNCITLPLLSALNTFFLFIVIKQIFSTRISIANL